MLAYAFYAADEHVAYKDSDTEMLKCAPNA
jgi:hypothetical protein